MRRILAVVAAAVPLGACSMTEMPARKASAAAVSPAAGQCPQPRTTERAPESYYARKNPLPRTAENLERGRLLYERDAEPLPCAECHGVNGSGDGPAGRNLVPPPRNFTCTETMNALPDGQLYWVVGNGSDPLHVPVTQGALQIERPGRATPFSAMRGYKESLSETEVWQIILYIRTLAR